MRQESVHPAGRSYSCPRDLILVPLVIALRMTAAEGLGVRLVVGFFPTLRMGCPLRPTATRRLGCLELDAVGVDFAPCKFAQDRCLSLRRLPVFRTHMQHTGPLPFRAVQVIDQLEAFVHAVVSLPP